MQTRNKPLDILRAFAILLVLGRHLDPYQGKHLLFKKILNLWQEGGWIGVDLFFVLSGFLIAGLLFKEHIKTGQISYRNFFIRRALKIFPAYYFMMGLSILILSFFFTIPASTLFSDLFFMRDYFDGIWGHTWSLAVEEKFYLFLPVLFILLTKFNKSKDSTFKYIPITFLIISIACLGFRIFNPFRTGYYNTYFFPFHLRFDSLFSGVFISYLYHYHSLKFKATIKQLRIPFLMIGLLFLSPAFLFSLDLTPFLSTVGFTLFYLGSGLILSAVIDDVLKPNLLTNSLAYLGSHSYSIYLWFIPIKTGLVYLFMYILPNGSLTWPNFAITYLVASIGIGITMSKAIEFPILKLRNQFYPSS